MIRDKESFLKKYQGKAIKLPWWTVSTCRVSEAHNDGLYVRFYGDFIQDNGLIEYNYYSIRWDQVTQIEIVEEKAKLICDCGKDKHGFACHLDFCPKYDNFGTGQF